MIYADTSCLLPLLRPEPLSERVWEAIKEESSVVISPLAELETIVQLKALWAGGGITRNQWRRVEAQFSLLRTQEPFDFRAPGQPVFQIALRQHRNSGQLHCCSMDRLHIAAMEELKISRLMTHDENQAKAAIEAGFKVIRPGRD